MRTTSEFFRRSWRDARRSAWRRSAGKLWLGWRVLEQDRALEQQQVQQRVERGADLIVSALQRAISVTEQRLVAGTGPGADEAVVVTFHDGRVEASSREGLAYFPVVHPLPEAPAATFARGEDLEFHKHDRAAAITSFRELARSSDSAIRAGALLRLGRNLHNVGRFEDALAAGNAAGSDPRRCPERIVRASTRATNPAALRGSST